MALTQAEKKKANELENAPTDGYGSFDMWWDKSRNEHFAHSVGNCCECNWRWWDSFGWVPAVTRRGQMKRQK